ncbi:MAG: DsbA family protein [Deltaproteobacteria bacterium]|nr:MAG: DsbA family protein [Deltaproteobacteria bacterium]
MRQGWLLGSGVVLLLTGMALPAAAGMQMEEVKALRLAKPVLDVATTVDGSKLFVLLKGGEVQMLTPGGELLDRFSGPAEAERLAVSSDGDRLYLSVGQEVRIIELATLVDLPVLNSPVKGAVEAPVTLTVFSDFQCPYCARLVPFLDEILAKNPDKVRVVFKQFPLRMHTMAQPAALASLAAREQGKFWPMHDLLFANHNQLSEDRIRALAKEAGLDLARFDRDRNAQKLRDEVLRDQGLGQQAGVQGTPAIFLNGRFLRERTAAGIQALIDREAARVRGAAK